MHYLKNNKKSKFNILFYTIFRILGDSWRFDSIPNIGIKNRVESSRIDSKKVEIDLGFDSIPNVGTVGSGRFQ